RARYDDSFRGPGLAADLLVLARRSALVNLAARRFGRPPTAVVSAAVPAQRAAESYVPNLGALARLAAPAPVVIALQPALAATAKLLTAGEQQALEEKERMVPNYRARVRAAYRAMESAARAAGLTVVDLDAALGTEARPRFLDECHFGDDTADRIALRL